jgi:hypothetical protein
VVQTSDHRPLWMTVNLPATTRTTTAEASAAVSRGDAVPALPDEPVTEQPAPRPDPDKS